MKTLLALAVLGLTATSALCTDWVEWGTARRAASDAILKQPISRDDTQQKILEELQKQTRAIEANSPIYISRRGVDPVPVTVVPTR